MEGVPFDKLLMQLANQGIEFAIVRFRKDSSSLALQIAVAPLPMLNFQPPPEAWGGGVGSGYPDFKEKMQEIMKRPDPFPKRSEKPQPASPATPYKSRTADLG